MDQRECTRQPCNDIAEVKAQLRDIERRLTVTEEDTKRNVQNISKLFTSQAEIKAMFEGLGRKIDNLETKLFSFLTQAMKAYEKGEDDDREERSTSLEKWLEFVKWVLGGTIVLAIGYIFGKS